MCSTLAAISGLAVSAGVFLAISVQRLGWGLEIAYAENSVLLGAARMAEGLAYYVEPSGDFAAVNFPPLFLYVVSLGFRLFGLEYWAGRGISLLSALTAGLLTGIAARKLGGSRNTSLAGAALFFVLYGLSDTVFDAALPDSMWLMFTAGAVAVSLGPLTPRRLAVAALLLTAAFYSKQWAVMYYPFFCLSVWARSRKFRTGLVVGVLLCVFTGFPYLIGHALTGGWFTYYTYELPSRHYFVSDHIASVLRRTLTLCPLAFVLALTHIVMARKRGTPILSGLAENAVMPWFLGGAAATAGVRMVAGSTLHDELPLYYGCLLLGMNSFIYVWRNVSLPRRAFVWTVSVLLLIRPVFISALDLRNRLPRAIDYEALEYLKKKTGAALAAGERVWPTHHSFFMKKYFDVYVPDCLGLADAVRYDKQILREALGWKSGVRLKRVFPAFHEKLLDGYYDVIIKENRPFGSEDISMIIDRYYYRTELFWTGSPWSVAPGERPPSAGTLDLMYPQLACRSIWNMPETVLMKWIRVFRFPDGSALSCYVAGASAVAVPDEYQQDRLVWLYWAVRKNLTQFEPEKTGLEEIRLSAARRMKNGNTESFEFDLIREADGKWKLAKWSREERAEDGGRDKDSD
ncbi:MAG: glycosyltransferase family 39 protein [Kiritimatiellia bacterium]